nr:uncharacterized protein LOC113823609 [Penaeus vannamei]
MMPSLELVITSEGQGGSDEQGEESGSSTTPPLKQPPLPIHTRAATFSKAATRNSSTTTSIAITTEPQDPRRDDRLVVTELDDDEGNCRQQDRKGRLALSVGQDDYGGGNYGEDEEGDDEEEEERDDRFPWTNPPDGMTDPGNGRPGVRDHDDGIEGWWTGGGPVATVKMVMETGVGVITRAWPLHQPARNLKLELSRATQVPPHFLQLVLRGRVLSDVSTLRDMGVEANETVQVGVSSKRPHTHPLTLLAPTTPTIPTPDVITVIVAEGEGVCFRSRRAGGRGGGGVGGGAEALAGGVSATRSRGFTTTTPPRRRSRLRDPSQMYTRRLSPWTLCLYAVSHLIDLSGEFDTSNSFCLDLGKCEQQNTVNSECLEPKTKAISNFMADYQQVRRRNMITYSLDILIRPNITSMARCIRAQSLTAANGFGRAQG